MNFWNNLLHFMGIDDTTGKWYGFWSGFASDLTIIAAAIAIPWSIYRRHNCNVKGCWRIGKHDFEEPDTKIKRLLCWRHHPDVKSRQLTKKDLREQLHLYLGDKPGKG